MQTLQTQKTPVSNVYSNVTARIDTVKIISVIWEYIRKANINILVYLKKIGSFFTQIRPGQMP